MQDRPIPPQTWDQIDAHLSRCELLSAFLLYRGCTGSSVREAKDAIGTRFRERFPELWKSYRNVEED